MAISVVASTKVSGATGGTTPAIDTTGANCIAIWLAYGGSPTVSDSKGNTYTADTANSNTVSGRWYYCLSATVGTGHTFTIAGGSVVASAVVIALAGVKTSAAFVSKGGVTVPSGTQSKFTVSVTPPEDDCIILMGTGLGTATISSVAGANGWTLDDWNTGVGGTNYGSIVTHKIQTTVATIAANEVHSTWTGTTDGVLNCIVFKAEPAAPPEDLTITTPVAYEVHQRSGTTGTIQISGTVTGSTEDIEASFAGGAYVTIATAVSSTFSGTLTGQAQGQGTLTVRKKATTTTLDTVANVGIGDVFVVGGDSISEGRGSNPQSYTHATLKAAKFTQADAWGDGVDGIDVGTSAGSHWPLLATQIMESQGVPVAFISVGTGSTDVAGSANSWAKPNTEYTGLTGQVTDSTVASVKGVLMHLGPNAVVNASTLSQATYNAALDTLAANLSADVAGAPKLNIGIFGEVSTGSPPDRVAALNNLRAAIIQAHGDNSNIKPGPVLIDLDYSDGVHPASDAQLQAVAKRWWVALSETYYGGSGGRGPRMSSAAWNGARTQITVIFDRNLKTGLSHSTSCWAVSDNGTPMTVSSVAYHGSNAAALVITTSAAAVGASGTTTVSFASGDTAVGAVVPLSADITMPSGAAIQIPAEPIYGGPVADGATAVTMSGPSGGVNGVASTDFTVGANGGITGTVVVTPSDAGAGGTFTPSTVSISDASPTGTFTYTPASVGAKTVSVTNNGGLTNPSSITYTVTAAMATTVSVTLTTDGTTPAASLTGLKWAYWDVLTPDLMTTAPLVKGSAETTDGSGVLTVAITGTTKRVGEVGYLLVTNSDGTTTQGAALRAFAAPVTVS